MNFYDELRNLNTFITLALRGEVLKCHAIRNPTDMALDPMSVMMQRIPAELRAAKESDFLRSIPDSERQGLNDKFEKNCVEFLKSEQDTGFAYLWATGIIRLWSLVEAFVQFKVTEKLAALNTLPPHSLLEGLGANLGKLSSLESFEKTEYLCKRLADRVPRADKRGIDRYEKLLEAVGLGGELPQALTDILNELCEFRNAVVHRHGICDSRLAKRCPNLGLRVGEPIRILHLNFEIYALAADCFHVEIIRREVSNAKDLEARAHIQFTKRLDELNKWLLERRSGGQV